MTTISDDLTILLVNRTLRFSCKMFCKLDVRRKSIVTLVLSFDNRKIVVRYFVNRAPDWFTFLVPAHLGSPGQRAVKRVCVCK